MSVEPDAAPNAVPELLRVSSGCFHDSGTLGFGVEPPVWDLCKVINNAKSSGTAQSSGHNVAMQWQAEQMNMQLRDPWLEPKLLRTMMTMILIILMLMMIMIIMMMLMIVTKLAGTAKQI